VGKDQLRVILLPLLDPLMVGVPGVVVVVPLLEDCVVADAYEDWALLILELVSASTL
jgi:hypothetical protein